MNTSQLPSAFNLQSSEMQAEIQRGFILRVYAWMTLGLVVTAAAAFLTLAIPGVLEALFSNRFIFIGLLIGELVLVVVLSAAISRFPPAVAGLLFTGYAVLNGVTLSLLCLVYTPRRSPSPLGSPPARLGLCPCSAIPPSAT